MNYLMFIFIFFPSAPLALLICHLNVIFVMHNEDCKKLKEQKEQFFMLQIWIITVIYFNSSHQFSNREIPQQNYISFYVILFLLMQWSLYSFELPELPDFPSFWQLSNNK